LGENARAKGEFPNCTFDCNPIFILVSLWFLIGHGSSTIIPSEANSTPKEPPTEKYVKGNLYSIVPTGPRANGI
jgi:hypothetical protein